MSNVEYRREGDIAVLIINNPPVNALGLAVRIGLLEGVAKTDDDPEIKAVVLIGANKTFVAGSDIREFGQKLAGPGGRVAMEAVESSKKPVIAALHGTPLGGGLELAMCAHYRIALASTQLGLPEVNLGMIPGGGGTQRLPRLVGAEAALDLIASGKRFDAKQALRLGVVDELVEGTTFDDLLRGALLFAQRAVAEQRPIRRVRDLNHHASGVDPAIFKKYRDAHAGKWRGLLAQRRVVDCIEAACTMPFEAGYAFEDQAFVECRESPQRAALSHLFFAEREAAKIPNLPLAIKPQRIMSVAIIGAGTMGGGIAMAFANSGIPVTQLDLDEGSLVRGRTLIKKNYDTSVVRGSMPQAKADEAFARITGTTSYQDIAECDLVVEAVFEDLEIKRQVFARLDTVMKPNAIFATNTSTLDIDKIASATGRPEFVVGMHFFSPANVMKLLECVRGAQSSPHTLATAMGVAKQIGKVPVLAGNCDGFIGNRILAAYGRQADFLLEEGATPWQIDAALQAFGLPMGIFLMRDMAGLDVGWRIRQQREPFRDTSLRYSPIADRIYEMGRHGQKTGAGYYKYDGRTASPDPQIEQLIIRVATDLGIQRKPISDLAIVDRIVIAMVNEGAKIVSEGHAARTSDIDVTYVYGYGFPRYEGGPMFWAERHGLSKIFEQVCRYHDEQREYWEPAPLLEKAAKLGSWKAAEGV